MTHTRTTKQNMKLILENIGLLRHADITLHPLCVIAGENDNGKSTVGKIVFCIIKAINRYKEDLLESKDFLIGEKIQEIYFSLRRTLGKPGPQEEELLRMLRSISLRNRGLSEQLAVIDQALKQLDLLSGIEGDAKAKVIGLREEINQIAAQPENTNQSIENAFNKVFASEFDASLLLQGAAEGRIELLDNEIQLISLKVNQNNEVTLLSEVEPIVIKDATFIDSPLILNYHDVLIRSQTLLEIDKRRVDRVGLSYTTLHTKDLFNKLREPVLPDSLFEADKSDLLNQIRSMVNGEISYDKRDRDFVFRRDQETISIKNTASGIKVFGLLQILLANDFVSKNTMLIFDEPENHLHPKWQLQLAQLLVNLSGKGVFILVSSHSPYFIEALKRYAERGSLDNDSGFFLAENRNIEDRDRLSDIFQVLAEPFEVFRQMDAEALRDE